MNWDETEHPRDDVGRFRDKPGGWIRRAAAGFRPGRAMAGMSTPRRFVEAEISRDETGRARIELPQEQDRREILALSRELSADDTKRGPRLRWGHEGVRDWWYTPFGPEHWVRRGDRAQMIDGLWYEPRKWGPLVPPREHWNGRTFFGIPKVSMANDPIPQDVWLAAQWDPTPGDRNETSPREDVFHRRVVRQGLDPNMLGSARGYRVARVRR